MDRAAVARATARLGAREQYARVAKLFGALADPTRARLVHALLQAELCTGDLAMVLSISDPAVSQHLRVLRRLRLVKSRRAGKFVYHSLDDDHVARLMAVGLTHAEHGAAAQPATRMSDAPLQAERARSAEYGYGAATYTDYR
jgi:ArsR family transcriptional regulator, lead/cadmium/zinc/bismuth-responsive transcriptional repressor